MSSLDRTFRRALTAVATASLVTVSLASIGTPVQAAASRAVFTQASPIHLGGDVGFGSPTNVPIPESGQLDPYPLELEIPAAAAIQDISVEVWLEHDRPADLELVLVGPSGHQVVLLNGAGGETPASTLMSFTADAETVLAPGDPLPSDDVRPASFGDLDLPGFPQTPSTDLSGFDGTLAGGTWRLYVYDAAAGAGGQLHEWGIHLDLVTTPYPSELAVAGIGDVSDVNVTFDGLTAEAPDDGNFLLVGPQGQRAMLMSDAGGHADPVTGLDLTFDDEAAAMIPSNRIDLTGSGTYQLSDYVADDEFVGLGRLVGVPSSLTVFDGTDPNGTWRLYAVDDQADGGLVSIEGWSLDIETDDLTAPVGTLAVAGGSARTARTTVDLAVTATDPGPKASGTRQMRFSNDGTTWSAFQPYAATAAWPLAPGQDGSRTVYAQLRDGRGNLSAVFSDAITLDTRAPHAIKVKPARHRSGVKPFAEVKVITTETLLGNSVSPTSVLLTRKGAGRVKAEVTVRGAKVILDPVKRLEPGAYRATVTSRVTDLAGNAFDARKKPGTQTLRWTFTV